ncbi:hypothetical protein BASA83_011195 [Batrachochytrium salamandrivorans]|nr:hypothetical protein BASA83_011195 [Batrachochytrium salamandrivorans]
MPQINGFSTVLMDHLQEVLPETITHSSSTFLGMRIQSQVHLPLHPVPSTCCQGPDPRQSIESLSTTLKFNTFSVHIANTGIDPLLFERQPHPEYDETGLDDDCYIDDLYTHRESMMLRLCVVVTVDARMVFAHTLRSRSNKFVVSGCSARRPVGSEMLMLDHGMGVIDGTIDSVMANKTDSANDSSRVCVELWHCKARWVQNTGSKWDNVAPHDVKRAFFADENDTRFICSNGLPRVVSLECTRLVPHPLLAFDIRVILALDLERSLDSRNTSPQRGVARRHVRRHTTNDGGTCHLAPILQPQISLAKLFPQHRRQTLQSSRGALSRLNLLETLCDCGRSQQQRQEEQGQQHLHHSIATSRPVASYVSLPSQLQRPLGSSSQLSSLSMPNHFKRIVVPDLARYKPPTFSARLGYHSATCPVMTAKSSPRNHLTNSNTHHSLQLAPLRLSKQCIDAPTI